MKIVTTVKVNDNSSIESFNVMIVQGGPYKELNNKEYSADEMIKVISEDKVFIYVNENDIRELTYVEAEETFLIK